MDTPTNRQLKFLNFFKIQYAPNVSKGQAGMMIAQINSTPAYKQRWEKYVYLTEDYGDDLEFKAFDSAELDNLVLPDDWSESEGRQKWTDAQVKNQMGEDESPFDKPQPPIELEGKSFMFTGKFTYGTRKDCDAAIESKGGIASKSKSPSSVDYLVIGENGNPTWKKGNYGSKIEKAILTRSKKGKPIIVGELHWAKFL
jgi:NAD-dependent DNA ligase